MHLFAFFDNVPPNSCIQVKCDMLNELDLNLVTTKCVIEEGKALGPQLSGAVLIAKRFQLRKCAHHKAAVPAAECIMSMIGTYQILCD